MQGKQGYIMDYLEVFFRMSNCLMLLANDQKFKKWVSEYDLISLPVYVHSLWEHENSWLQDDLWVAKLCQVFFTWHYMPTRKRRIYFLDKFCVHQVDDKLKQLGRES